MKRASIGSPEDAIVYHPGAIDYGAVDEFLDLLDSAAEADRIAHISAKMVFKEEGASADQLVRNAIELREEAKRRVILRRALILSEMNCSSVQRLAEKLTILDAASSEGEDRDQSPYRAILVTVLEKFEAVKDGPPWTDDSNEIQRALADADQRAQVPRPETPCNLTAALAYVSGMKRPSKEVLEKAFQDFLSVFQLQRVINARLHEDQEGDSPWNSEDFLLRRAEEERFVSGFKPGVKPPPDVAESTRTLVRSSWGRSNSVNLRSLSWLANSFYPFWIKHRKAYLAQYETDKVAKKRISATNAASGREGVRKREHTAQMDRVTEWLRSAEATGKRPEDILDSFVVGTELVTEKGRRKLSAFLGGLNEHVANKTNVTDAVEHLIAIGMKSMTSSTFEECADLLRLHLSKLPPSPKKKRK